MAVKVPEKIRGIRVWEQSCQPIARSGEVWGTIRPRCDLPVHVSQNAEELKRQRRNRSRLDAYRHCAERPSSDFAAVLNQTQRFAAERQKARGPDCGSAPL